MKNIFKTLILITGFAAVWSCESYLNEEPITDFFADDIYATEEGVEAAVTGAYIQFASFAYNGSGFHNIVMPISGKFYSTQFANEDATSLNCTPSNTNVNDLWRGIYSTINATNNIISRLEDPNNTLANKNSALANAYLLRGISYLDLVRLWGDVPLRTEPSNVNTLNVPRTPKGQIYAQIQFDLEKAKEMLPTVGAATLGRPANLVANAFLAKMYMQLAGEDNGNPSLWQNAKEELLPIYGQYALVNSFEELFELGNENNSESMFEIQYTLEGGTRSSDLVRLYVPNNFYENLSTFGRIRPNKEVYDQHSNQYPSDPRIDAGFFHTTYQKFDGSSQNIYPTTSNGNNGFPCIKKYTDENYNGTTTGRNFYKLRYADVLLMLAEVTNEIDGPTTEAYGYVNEVMARARTNPDNTQAADPADWFGLSQDQFRFRIMREYQYELLGEGHIWFNTRRRGYDYFLQEVIETHNNFPDLNVGNQDVIYPVSVKNMLLPIPSEELNSNQAISAADQNPGY